MIKIILVALAIVAFFVSTGWFIIKLIELTTNVICEVKDYIKSKRW